MMPAMNLRLLLLLCVLTSVPMWAQPRIGYLTPDLGTTRFGTYVEIIGPAGAISNFGTDGMYANNTGDNVRVICERPADTSRVKIGPAVVSWNGRMISTTIFVAPTVEPNSEDWRQLRPEFRIPVQVVVNGQASSSDTFYIVKPWPIGDIRSNAERVFGAGSLGIRSRRGAMLVDSVLLGGQPAYTVATADCDAQTPGNQGYLPVSVISMGRLVGTLGTSLNVNAVGANGGPGGGGGGGGYSNIAGVGGSQRGFVGGDGFTGGGPGGVNNTILSSLSERRRPGTGSGAQPPENKDSIDGGASLNGQPGGTSTVGYENAGGGTGHPFGLSGLGCVNKDNCVPPEAYGGGTGYREGTKGGGGGYGTDGAGIDLGNGRTSGGRTHGNLCLVPLAGGSGGASGNPSGLGTASSGGGGGGAISIHALNIGSVVVRADGGTTSLFDLGSGAGSGGGIILGSRTDVVNASAVANGGIGESSTIKQPLAGGVGRKRYDIPGSGVVDTYSGAGMDTVTNVLRQAALRGFGNGNDVIVWAKGERGPWIALDTMQGYATRWPNDGTKFTMPGTDTLYYICVTQRIIAPATAPFAAEPSWVMSQSGWNIVRIFGPPVIDAPAVVTMPTYGCPGSVVRDTIPVRNMGESPLIITAASFPPNSGFRLVEPTTFPDTIQAFEEHVYVVEYAPLPTHAGLTTTTFTINSNDTAVARNPLAIAVRINVEPFDLRYSWRGIPLDRSNDTLDFGPLCLGVPTPVGTTEELVVRNVGLSTATLERFRSLNPGLVVSTANLPHALVPNGFRNLNLTFTAKQVGLVVVPVLVDIAECPEPDTIWVRFVGLDARMRVDGTGQFGDVPVGETSRQIIDLVNDGTSDLRIETTPALAPPFVLRQISPIPPVVLEPGARIQMIVEYTPTTQTDDTAVMRFVSVMDGRSCPDSVEIVLSGKGVDVGYRLSQQAINVGQLFPCDTIRDSVVVTNTGNADLTLLYPAFIAGPDAAAFSVVGQPSVDVTLAPGASATYTVATGTPQPPDGLRSALLVIRTTSTAIGSIDVPLSVSRISTDISGPRDVDFGIVALGTTTSRTASYINNSGRPIRIARVSTSTPTLRAATPLGTVPGPGGTFDCTLTYTTGQEGALADTVWIVFDEPCVDSIRVIVRANSVSGAIAAPNALTFGDVSQCTTGRDSIVISNPAAVGLDLIDVALEGPDAALFRIENPGVVTGVTVPPGDSVKLYLTFDPRATSDGRKQATLVLRARVNDQPIRVTVQVDGTRRTALPSSPGEVVFGFVDITASTQQRVTLVNTSGETVHVTGVRVKGTSGTIFTVAGTNVPRDLAPGEALVLDVTFSPTEERLYVDSVIVSFDRPCADERVVPVRGNGRLNVELAVILPMQDGLDPAADNHRIPIRAAVVAGQTDVTNATLRLRIRYVTQTFVARAVEGGRIIANVSTGGMTDLDIELDNVNVRTDTVEVGAVVGSLTLGRTDSTSLVVVDGELVMDVATPNLRPVDGYMTLNICREGGDRFVEKAGGLALTVAGNPVRDIVNLTVDVFEPGDHELVLVDAVGATVDRWQWIHERGATPLTITRAAGDLASGAYRLVLRTPTRVRSVSLQIVH